RTPWCLAHLLRWIIVRSQAVVGHRQQEHGASPMTTTTATNRIHKVRALLTKTTANGCTPGQAASALSLASTIVFKHGLNPADFIWPEPPAGWRWEGVRGHGGTVVEAPA